MVLEIFLVLVERVVLVDVLDIGRRLVGRLVALGRVLGVGRVAFGEVDALVAVEDAHLVAVEVCAAIVVVVVACRVCHNAVEDLGRYLALDLLQVLLIGGIELFLLGGEAVKAYVLSHARAGFIIKSVGHTGAYWHASPHGLGVVRRVVVEGQTAFIEFLTVLEHVLADLPEVDVEFAAITLVVARVDERVEHPEFDVLDVLRLEVGVVELTHHTAPVLLWILQASVGVEVGVEVVSTSFGGVVGEVEHVERRGFRIGVL